MHRAGKIALTALRRAAGKEKPLDMLDALWPLIVGPRLAAQTRPVAWERGWVQVAVGDRDWQEQLERMPDALRGRINRWWGTEIVEKVSFTRGRVSRKPIAGRGRAKAEKSEWAPAEIRELKDELETIRDPRLRELVGRVFQKYVAKKDAG